MDKKRLPIGISDFNKLIIEDCYFVDKKREREGNLLKNHRTESGNWRVQKYTKKPV